MAHYNPIKVGRAKKGWTAAQLADALNVTRQTVSNWERNTVVPPVSQIMQLHYKLDVPLSELMDFFKEGIK